VQLIEELRQATRDVDFDRYGQLIAEAATFRAAGVPAALGGVLSGREAIVEQLRRTAGASRIEVKQMFGDDRMTGQRRFERAPIDLDRVEVLLARKIPGSCAQCVEEPSTIVAESQALQ
jgi:hypothetical protein